MATNKQEVRKFYDVVALQGFGKTFSKLPLPKQAIVRKASMDLINTEGLLKNVPKGTNFINPFRK